MYGGFVCDRVNIGANARVAGFVCDRAVIGEGATSMGNLVHAYTDPHADWWGPDEAAPTIGAGATVGYGALVVGGVRVGPGAYIAAGAVVTRDVDAGSIVTGINCQTARAVWKGRHLG